MIENDVERSLSSSQEFSKWQEFDSNIDIDAKFTNLETRKVWMKIASWLASFGFVKYGTITYSIELCVWLSKCALLFDWLDDIWTSCRSISSVPPPSSSYILLQVGSRKKGKRKGRNTIKILATCSTDFLLSQVARRLLSNLRTVVVTEFQFSEKDSVPGTVL